MTQSELATTLRITPQAISQWERNETVPEFGRIGEIAAALRTTVDSLISDDPRYSRRAFNLFISHSGGSGPGVDWDNVLGWHPYVDGETPHAHILGYVGANSQVHFYDLKEPYLDTIFPAGPGASVAVEIRGPSLGDMLDRWFAFYEDRQEPVAERHFGKICVVCLADGRILLRKVQPGPDNSCILTSDTEAPIEAAQITWAACVTHMVPRWAVRVAQMPQAQV